MNFKTFWTLFSILGNNSYMIIFLFNKTLWQELYFAFFNHVAHYLLLDILLRKAGLRTIDWDILKVLSIIIYILHLMISKHFPFETYISIWLFWNNSSNTNNSSYWILTGQYWWHPLKKSIQDLIFLTFTVILEWIYAFVTTSNVVII